MKNNTETGRTVEFLKFPLSPQNRQRIEDFLMSVGLCSPFQTPAWGDLKEESFPGEEEPFFLIIEKSDRIEHTFLLIKRRLGHGFATVRCERGPVSKNPDEIDWPTVIENIKLHFSDCTHLEFYPNRTISNYPFGKAKSDSLKFPAFSLLIDLTKREDTILSQMKQKGRYNIKKASQNKDISVRIGGTELLDDYYRIFEATKSRQGFEIQPRKYFETLLHSIKAFIILAYFRNEPISGGIFTVSGDLCTYLVGASSNEHKDLMAPYLVQWTAIKEAGKLECTQYDFLGISPPPHKDSHHLAGVTKFKLAFGGDLIEEGYPRILKIRPLKYLIFKIIKLVLPLFILPTLK